jgi:hypothetical protein
MYLALAPRRPNPFKGFRTIFFAAACVLGEPIDRDAVPRSREWTGSLVQTVWLAPADSVLVNLSGHGYVNLNVRSKGGSDRVVPFEQERMRAATIPHARFVTLESDNHVVLHGEPAWDRMMGEIERFLR